MAASSFALIDFQIVIENASTAISKADISMYGLRDVAECGIWMQKAGVISADMGAAPLQLKTSRPFFAVCSSFIPVGCDNSMYIDSIIILCA